MAATEPRAQVVGYLRHQKVEEGVDEQRDAQSEADQLHRQVQDLAVVKQEDAADELDL